MRTLVSETTTSVLAPMAVSAAAASSSQRSPWHSPVPYLFGGLAAMLGLIAFALLILACSYWKLSGQLENRERDLESGGDGKEGDSANKGSTTVYEEKILVIMAGEERPTFLATPVSAKAVSLEAGIEKIGNRGEEEEEKNEDSDKTEKEMRSHESDHSTNSQENEETQEQNH